MKNKVLETVILCGGSGLRLRGFSEDIPKPLVKIGDQPILLHLIRFYCRFGFNRFILCLGYKAELIRAYFLENFKSVEIENNQFDFPDEGFQILFSDAGIQAETGERILKIKNEISGEHFFCTYADGLADIDLNKLIEFHIAKEKVATLTAVQPILPYGVITCNNDSVVSSFVEKPKLESWSNGGFFVFSKNIFSFLHPGDVLELSPFQELLKKQELAAFLHKGFWQPMDNYKDIIFLNKIWENGNAPWTMDTKKTT